MSRPNRAELDSAFSSGRMTQAEAARRLGLGYLVLRYHVKMGRLATVQVDGRVWVRQEDLEAFKEATEGMLTIRDAASELGVSDSTVRHHVWVGHTPFVWVHRRQMIRQQDLDTLRTLVERQHAKGSEVRAALETGLLTRSDVARELGVSHQRVSQLVKARSLATVTVGGRALVRPEDLDAFKRARDPQKSGMVTMADAARELGVNARIMYDNASRGELLTVKVGGRHLVRRVDLDAFKRNRAAVAVALESGLLTMRDVAQATGYKKVTVQQWVFTGRLASVKVGGRRLVRPEDLDAFKRNRTAVAAALESGLLTMKDVAQASGYEQVTVQQWVHSGRLASVKVGRRRLVRREDLDAFMQKPQARTGPKLKGRIEQAC
ncbi:helix-turn-helix domain-containing protein [Burkholderia gladioli]|uniref:helix-turn-helix domain-containing protein n=1 Tax=Burkholderia gladioli TaxID=28095 RepID=UPI000CFF0BE7|nr:helix-turn-helix domain-containing protein [Burkholderia gladioli]PRE88266.1 hypothetical protein C6Q13_10965 [Burkholderia gladioli]